MTFHFSRHGNKLTLHHHPSGSEMEVAPDQLLHLHQVVGEALKEKENADAEGAKAPESDGPEVTTK